jgi:hypothetical protein
VRSLLLKVGATALTVGVAAAAAVHVSGHLKSASAPLHPQVVGPPAASGAGAGRLSLTPSVRSGSAEPVTSTYVS